MITCYCTYFRNQWTHGLFSPLELTIELKPARLMQMKNKAHKNRPPEMLLYNIGILQQYFKDFSEETFAHTVCISI